MARVKIEVPIEHKQPNKALHTPVNNQATSQQTPESRGGTLTVKKLVVIILVALLFIYVFNLISERSRLEKELKSSSTSQQTDNIVDEISKTVELPSDETPQTRTIEDAAKFKQGSAVLNEINDGDVWIFYPKAGKQVFYRPSSKKVIFVVPLTPTDTTN